ncbi:MAG: peptidoglycan DD-metalloendopeptidase family protein [Gammaproteobacteria bacterium]|nr:peptidoglycan DD-metalloendopeptidase family protein [Gammaproteobacteria bacterium]
MPLLPEEDYEFSQTEIIDEEIHDLSWQTIPIHKGDNLALIFDRLNLNSQDLHKIISLGNKAATLKRLYPDHDLRFQIENGQLSALEYEVSLTETFKATRQNNEFTAQTIITELETRISETSGVIHDSLFLAAQRAGLSDNITMQLIGLYGWDIDFALDIRDGDRFYVIYEEKYKDGIKVTDGPILAAEFINQDKSSRAVRYMHADGHTDYYSHDGYSMRKAFLRTPLNFTRISSQFSLNRKHPVLNKMRAHRGVDYAAPTGTPIFATGDGMVAYAGRDGGYGNVVILRHGGKYTTLYAHMSKFAHGITSGKQIKQGQTIGYVGMSGLATGPHLHYEFRINNVHHNPLTVELPKAMPIPDEIMTDFKTQTYPLLTQLEVFTGRKTFTAASVHNRSIISLNNDSDAINAPHQN